MEEKVNRRPCPPKQHNHEVLGSVRISGCCDNAHNHRFATVSGDAIPCDGSHVHEIKFTTDSCNGHDHEFCGTSGPAIEVGCGRHVQPEMSAYEVCDRLVEAIHSGKYDVIIIN